MSSVLRAAYRQDPSSRAPASAIVIGNFDGVHRGHQAVLGEAQVLASARGLARAVLTFDPHPAAVLGDEAPPRLATVERRVALLLGHADVVWVRAFDADFAATPPERFAAELLSEKLGAKLVVVGENFRFGHKRAGDLALLKQLGQKLGFEVHAHALAGDQAGLFSSSRARGALAQGDLAGAEEVLGRPHSIAGTVVTGEQRGRTLGFPTANLSSVTEIVPPRGVYAVRVHQVVSPEGAMVEELSTLGGGVMNHGVRPTLGSGLEMRLEAHVFDFAGDLYGQRLRIELVKKLRDEMKFGGLDALKSQIATDAAAARAALA